MKHLYCVKEQMVLDGNFPTVASPNPENPEGFYLAIDLANQAGADFILGTDPDSDRVGIMVRSHDGSLCARYRQPDRRADAGLPHRGHAPGGQAAGASLFP